METIEQVIMNSEGQLGLGLRVRLYDRDHVEELAKLPGYTLRVSADDFDGWLIFSGKPDAPGPWVWVQREFVDGKMEVLGAL